MNVYVLELDTGLALLPVQLMTRPFADGIDFDLVSLSSPPLTS